MNEPREVLWRGIQPVLRDFAERIVASDSTVSYLVARTSNDAFLIRAYASLRKSLADSEIAVTVDAAFENGEIALSVDVCMDDGEVLADGPEATMPVSAILLSSGTRLVEWLRRLEYFLASIESIVKDRLAALS